MNAARILVGFLLAISAAIAQPTDTLRNYVHGGGYVFYADPNMTMQAARFEARGAGHIVGVNVMLGGSSANGSVRMHIFGHEGGLAAPALERDLVRPITIRKTAAGIQRISVELPSDIRVTSREFYIAFDNISKNVTLLSDRRLKPATCAWNRDTFALQALRDRRGRWRWGALAFAVDVVMQFDRPRSSNHGFSDVTASVGIADTLSGARSIAWGDYDNDGWNDLLVDGRLYHNERGGHFADVTGKLGLSAAHRAGFFFDINNDGHSDLLFIGDGDRAAGALLYLNDVQSMHAAQVHLPDLSSPSAVSIADADGDGFLDLFVGMSGGRGPSCRLLLNDRANGFSDASALLDGGDSGTSCVGSQWVDLDGDGDLDLFAAFDTPGGDRAWIRDGARFTPADPALFQGTEGVGSRVGCHWMDADNDGVPNLLAPRRVPVAMEQSLRPGENRVIRGLAGAGRPLPADEAIEYEEARAGGAWGDVDNDGRPDIILTTSCGCRYASVYEQPHIGEFVEATDIVGLRGLAAGDDAMWIDYDNDGRLDLATFVDGHFRLLRNDIATPNNALTIDLDGPDAIGATVDVYIGDIRATQQVSSGRGLLMQEPIRLHFGIATARAADSVIVRWANGAREIHADVAAGEVMRIREGTGVASSSTWLTGLTAQPNPAADHVTFAFSLAGTRDVEIAIYTLDGRRVARVAHGGLAVGRNEVVWDLIDELGERAPQGTYLYRVRCDGAELTGRIVVVR